MSVVEYLTTCEVASEVRQEDDLNGWLKARSFGVGGSEVGAICGVSNYGTALTLYLKKTGQYEEEFTPESLERMEWGHRLEDIVAQAYADKSGKKVMSSPASLRHKTHKWALANVDRFIVDEEGVPYGVLECKTAGEFMNGIWEDGELPMAYIYQLNWYLFVTGLSYGAYACLVGGNKFHYYEVYRNDELINEMFSKAAMFWNHNVLNMIQPEISGLPADTEYVKNKHKEVKAKSEVVLQDESDDLATEAVALKAEIKRLEMQLDGVQNKLKDELKDNEIGYTANHIIKWSPRQQNRVDIDKLKLMYPAIYTTLLKQSSYRVMTIKELG